MMFRDLRADEIECRVAQISKTGAGFSLLLYKDARADQIILDETVGAMNWKKHYDLIDGQLFCTIEIWDSEKKQWIGKQDVGIESNTEAEKGRASDAQKRSGFAWGLGRELYTAPFIWVTNGDPKKDKFEVDSIEIKDKKIVALSIKNKKTGEIVYTLNSKAKKPAPKKTASPAPAPVVATPVKEEAPAPAKAEAPKKAKFPNRNEFIAFCKDNDLDTASLCKELNLTKNSPDEDFIPALVYAVKVSAQKDADKAEAGLDINLPFEM